MTDRFCVTIFHNPACGTSRNALAMIEAAGYEPVVVDYLRAGWPRPQLIDLAQRAGVTVRDLLREKDTPAAQLGLLGAEVDDDRLLDAMCAHPILVNRPIVATPKGVALCRPSERVFALLEETPQTFVKEDGEVVKPGG